MSSARAALMRPSGWSRCLTVGGLAVLMVTSGSVPGTPAWAEPDSSVVAASVVAPTEVAIVGSVAVGQTVTADEGAWTPEETIFSYEWRSNGSAVAGAADRSFTVPPALVDTSLTVIVTGTAPDATTSWVE